MLQWNALTLMRILIIEDDEETAAALKVGLESECYSVDVEHDGEKGSYRARTEEYDLVLLDNMLPGKEGAEVCKELRQYKISVPVLMLSVQSEIDRKISVLNCGADDYMTKPYSFEEVAARIKALLRRPRAFLPSELRVGDLALDTAKYMAFRGKKRVYLTTKEFALLEYLMRNEGRVISRAKILEHVWDRETDQFTNTIEAHIYNLRRKVDIPGKKRLIRTVPGRGYTLGISL